MTEGSRHDGRGRNDKKEQGKERYYGFPIRSRMTGEDR